jgi:hypothetical protein
MPNESRIPQPTDAQYENDMLGFIQEAIQESDAFLRAQPGYDKISKTRKAIHSTKSSVLGGGTSGIEANHVAKAGVQLVAALTDTRPFWEYRTFNPNFKKQTQILGKLSLHLWLQHQWDMRWADLMRGCATSGTSYAHQTWNSRLQDIDLQAEDCRDVLPIRPNDYHSIQSAFGVILRRERTVNYMRQTYPEDLWNYFTPDRDGSLSINQNTRYSRLMDKLGSPFRDVLWKGQRPAKDLERIPTLDEFTVYLDDERTNESSKLVYMGDWHTAPESDCPQCRLSGTPHPLNNWSYKVHPGERIYPNKRCIVATTNKVLYDNTSIYWHGLYPMCKLTLDPWDDTFIGKGLLWDTLPMQKFLDRLLKVLDTHYQKWQQPDLFVDKNSTSISDFNKINTGRPGLKMRINPVAGRGPELRYPDPLPGYFFDTIKFAIDEIGSLSGARDMSSMLALNQLPSSDSVERIMEALTPENRLRSKIMEAFTREFALITSYNIAQFYTVAQRMTILGPDGVTEEDFDYDPGVFIPDYVHADDFDEQGKPTVDAMVRGPLPRYNRAKEFLRQFSMHIAPGSLLSSSEVTDKLLYLQLARAGWLDIWTLLDKLGIPNVGKPPEGKDTITDRLQVQMEMGLGMQESAAGRKASGQEMPRIKISESG